MLPVAALVATLPGWSERQSAARAIAHEVARVSAVSQRCDQASAAGLARSMSNGLGVAEDVIATELDCQGGARLPRGGAVTARVIVAMPALEIPGLVAVDAWRWTAVHSEPIDPYASAP